MIIKFLIKNLPWKILIIIYIFLIIYFLIFLNTFKINGYLNFEKISLGLIFLPIFFLNFFHVGSSYNSFFTNSFLQKEFLKGNQKINSLIFLLFYFLISFLSFLLSLTFFYFIGIKAFAFELRNIDWSGIIFSGFLAVLWSLLFSVLLSFFIKKNLFLFLNILFSIVLIFGFVIIPFSFFSLKGNSLVILTKIFIFIPSTSNSSMLFDSFYGNLWWNSNSNQYLEINYTNKLFNILYPLLFSIFNLIIILLIKKKLFLKRGKNMEPILTISELSKNYLTKNFSKKNVLNQLSLKIFNKDVVCVMGKNGSGKTTLLKIINGFIEKSGGEIKFNYEYQKNPLEKVSLVLQENIFPSGFSVKNFYKLIISVLKKPDMVFIEDLKKQLGLNNFFDNSINKCSGGERQRLNLFSILVDKPKILLLDEITNNLDPNGQRFVMNFIKKYAYEQNAAIIYCSHNIDEVMKIANKVFILDRGKISKEFIVNDSNSLIVKKEINNFYNNF